LKRQRKQTLMARAAGAARVFTAGRVECRPYLLPPGLNFRDNGWASFLSPFLVAEAGGLARRRANGVLERDWSVCNAPNRFVFLEPRRIFPVREENGR
jgi:hypothetical protein